MSLLNDDSAQSEWLKQALSQQPKIVTKKNTMKTDCCENPKFIITNDWGSRQKCANCGWSNA